MNLKKIIAREGVTIISLVFVSAVFLYLGHWQSTYTSKRARPSLKEIQSVLSQVKIVDEKNVVCPSGQKIEFDSKPTEEDIYWACTAGVNKQAKDLSKIPDKQLFELANVPLKERPFMQRVNFSNWGLFFFIGIYPLYLLLRFVFWAIKTLKEK